MTSFVLPHINISNRAISRDYQAPRESRGNGATSRDRAEHGARLQLELATAFGVADVDRTNDERLNPPSGIYLEVELRRGAKADVLERKSDGVYPATVQALPNETTKLALFVPDDARTVLQDILRDYTAGPLTEKGKPPRKDVVEPIEAIRQARLETFWTDHPEALPADAQTSIWWEVWCFKGQANNVRDAAASLNANVAEEDKWLYFPEVVVIPIFTARAAIELMLFATVGIAELRRASATPTFFVDEDRAHQLEWAQNLAERTIWPNNDVPAVCLFDTGVNRAHVLLEPALSADHATSVRLEWGATDGPEGHGTGMAGLALYGDLLEPLSDERELVLSHRLESVKILPPDGFPPNDPRAYGSVTQAATAKAEILRPDSARVFCMAVTNLDVSGSRSTTWSSAIDQAASGTMLGDENAPRRLFVISTGNAPAHIERERILDADDYPVEDPAQAWNALTVGGYTDKIAIDEVGREDWTPFSQVGDISPFTRTSVTWPQSKCPFKPEIVMEAGNRAVSPSGQEVLSVDSLGLLTTGADVAQHSLVAFSATSAATAQAARLAARLTALFPDAWPEMIRALIIHSAEWTDSMIGALNAAPNKRAAYVLLRKFGYGVPTFERAAASASNHLALIAQNTITPFKSQGGRKFRDCHFYKLPWPKAILEGLGEQEVSFKITLSYFIEPNPGRSAAVDPQTYQSFGLRFDLRRRLENLNDFVKRVNPLERDDPLVNPAIVQDDGWMFGPQSIAAGSVHCDVWTGPAVHLAARDTICIKPVMGWWRSRGSIEACNRSTRYALVATLSAPGIDVDLHTSIINMVENQVDVEIAF